MSLDVTELDAHGFYLLFYEAQWAMQQLDNTGYVAGGEELNRIYLDMGRADGQPPEACRELWNEFVELAPPDLVDRIIIAFNRRLVQEPPPGT